MGHSRSGYGEQAASDRGRLRRTRTTCRPSSTPCRSDPAGFRMPPGRGVLGSPARIERTAFLPVLAGAEASPCANCFSVLMSALNLVSPARNRFSVVVRLPGPVHINRFSVRSPGVAAKVAHNHTKVAWVVRSSTRPRTVQALRRRAVLCVKASFVAAWASGIQVSRTKPARTEGVEPVGRPRPGTSIRLAPEPPTRLASVRRPRGPRPLEISCPFPTKAVSRPSSSWRREREPG